MERLGEEFLAGSGFALQQEADIGADETGGLVEAREQCFILAGDSLKRCRKAFCRALDGLRAHADIDGCDDLNEKRRAAADHADDVVLDQCGVHIRCEGVDIAFEKVAEGAAADEVGMAPVAADFVGEEMEGSLVDRDDRAF